MAPKTSSTRFVLPRGVAGTEPSNAEAGTLSYDATTDTLRIKKAAGWVDFTSGGGGSGDLTEVQAGSGILVTSGTGPIPIVAADFGAGAGQVPTTASVSAVQTNLTSHTSNTSNPHSVTAAQVGAWASTLSSQMAALAAKTSLVDADVLALEDSADSNSKKKITFANLRTSLGGSAGAFTMAGDIAPNNHWGADFTTNSGGFVSVLLDQGSDAKNLSQATGSLQAALGTDGNGKLYILPDGVDDYYQAAATNDWTFLSNNSTPYTIGGVWDIATALTAVRVFLDNCDGTTTNVGASIFATYESATMYGGVDFFVTRGGAPLYMAVDARPLVLSGPVAWAIRFNGQLNSSRNPTGGLVCELWIAGRMVAYAAHASPATAASAANPTGTLRLFRRITSSAALFNGRLYQLWIKKGYLPDRKLNAWFQWANTTWGAAG